MYNQFADDIYRYLFVHVRDVALAQDLTADTFLKAWKQFANFDRRHPRGWLYAIARNTLTDHWRKKKPLALDEAIEIIDEETPTNEELLDITFDITRAAKAVVRLPEDMKSVITLRFLQGYSVKQTAEALSLSEGNIRVIQYRALKRLRKELS